MKKIIALLLAAVMLFALVACGDKEATPDASQTQAPAPEQTQTPEPTDSAATPTNDVVVEPGDDPSEGFNEAGFFSSGVDPQSRETYNIVYSYMRPMSLFQQINDDLVEMEDNLNIKITDYCANSDIDALIQNIELFADQGADGYIIVIDPTAKDRICQVLDETGLPYIALINTVHDDQGRNIVPSVGLEGYSAGGAIVEWMYENYQTYWGDIDTSRIGLMDFNWSLNTDFNDRYEGAKDKYLELLPDNADLVFDADGASGKLDEQTGYDLATAILSAHPEVEYWFVPCCLEQYAQGTARAVEALGMEDRVLVVDISGDLLPREWDGGYEGCWVASYAVTSIVYAVPSACAIVSMIDGMSTPDTIWANEREEGDLYTNFNPIGGMITKETYKDYFASIREKAGL